jgi:hypothetical protein
MDWKCLVLETLEQYSGGQEVSEQNIAELYMQAVKLGETRRIEYRVAQGQLVAAVVMPEWVP